MATQEAPDLEADAQRFELGKGAGALLIGNVCQLSLFVSGKPVAKARPRTTRTGHTYTPDNTATWEQHVGWQVREQLSRLVVQGVSLPMPFTGRVVITMRFNFDKPKSTPKKVKHKLKKPDFDNLAKSITDVLQAGHYGVGVFQDDSQITDAVILKRFSDDEHPQGVEIELTCWLT